jgi:protein TonB
MTATESHVLRVARWGGSLAVVLGLHAGGAVALFAPRAVPDPGEAPPAAVMIELAPLPKAPEAPPMEVPPGPQAIETPPPPPPEPEPEPEPPKVEEPPPLPVEPEVVLPKPPRPKPPAPRPPPRSFELAKPTPKKLPAPAPATVAPPRIEAPPAPIAAVPVEAAAAAPTSNAVPDWESLLLARLERFKRYPRTARLRGEEGIAQIRFVIDRDGKLLDFALDKSSGVATLDDETLALLERAQPLPPPPPELAGTRVELVVPVRYFLRHGRR